MPPVARVSRGAAMARGFPRLGRTVAPIPLADLNQRSTTVARPASGMVGAMPGVRSAPSGIRTAVHLPRALAKGASLFPDTTVTRVLTDPTGERVTGVEVVTKQGRDAATLHASLVVLAAFSIENPRLLLASSTDKHPKGLGNATDQVGRYVMTHLAGVVNGIFDEDTQHYMGALRGPTRQPGQLPEIDALPGQARSGATSGSSPRR